MLYRMLPTVIFLAVHEYGVIFIDHVILYQHTVMVCSGASLSIIQSGQNANEFLYICVNTHLAKFDVHKLYTHIE